MSILIILQCPRQALGGDAKSRNQEVSSSNLVVPVRIGTALKLYSCYFSKLLDFFVHTPDTLVNKDDD